MSVVTGPQTKRGSCQSVSSHLYFSSCCFSPWNIPLVPISHPTSRFLESPTDSPSASGKLNFTHPYPMPGLVPCTQSLLHFPYAIMPLCVSRLSDLPERTHLKEGRLIYDAKLLVQSTKQVLIKCLLNSGAHAYMHICVCMYLCGYEGQELKPETHLCQESILIA